MYDLTQVSERFRPLGRQYCSAIETVANIFGDSVIIIGGAAVRIHAEEVRKSNKYVRNRQCDGLDFLYTGPLVIPSAFRKIGVNQKTVKTEEAEFDAYYLEGLMTHPVRLVTRLCLYGYPFDEVETEKVLFREGLSIGVIKREWLILMKLILNRGIERGKFDLYDVNQIADRDAIEEVKRLSQRYDIPHLRDNLSLLEEGQLDISRPDVEYGGIFDLRRFNPVLVHLGWHNLLPLEGLAQLFQADGISWMLTAGAATAFYTKSYRQIDDIDVFVKDLEKVVPLFERNNFLIIQQPEINEKSPNIQVRRMVVSYNLAPITHIEIFARVQVGDTVFTPQWNEIRGIPLYKGGQPLIHVQDISDLINFRRFTRRGLKEGKFDEVDAERLTDWVNTGSNVFPFHYIE
ncbi:MAG: hypothetical protein N3E38_02215 [Candidatus Aenigmarchaeota archaeon]|nr:hypothetical protein [Candidatus Aenigmarchaeota archaeon]